MITRCCHWVDYEGKDQPPSLQIECTCEDAFCQLSYNFSFRLIVRLSLCESRLTDAHVERICASQIMLRALDISQNKHLTGRSAKAISQCKSPLKELSLYGCWHLYQSLGFEALAEFFRATKTLQTLNIGALTVISDAHLGTLLEGLVECAPLTDLDFSHKNIMDGPRDAEFMCKILRQNKLKRLALCEGHWGSEDGDRQICDALREATSLRKLDCSMRLSLGCDFHGFEEIFTEAIFCNLALTDVCYGRENVALFDRLARRNALHLQNVQKSIATTILCLTSLVGKDIARLIAKMMWIARFDPKVWHKSLSL